MEKEEKERKTERQRKRSGLSENKSSRDLAACRRKSRVTQMYVADLSARMDLREFTQRAIDAQAIVVGDLGRDDRFRRALLSHYTLP